MKIWKLLPDTVNYSSLVMKPTISIDLIKSFDGRTQQATWNPILLDYSINNDFFELSDYPSFSLPVCSKSAVTIFSEEIKGCLEFLPVITCFKSNCQFFIMNVINVVSAIDYSKSQYKCFKDGKRIIAFQKYAFLEDVVNDQIIFKTVDEKRSTPFVTQAFIDIVVENNLKGFMFKLVWDSEYAHLQ